MSTSIACRLKPADQPNAINVPAVGGVFPNLRMLPWNRANVTLMHLDGAADFALTGYTVAVVQDADGSRT